MAINNKLIVQEAASGGGGGDANPNIMLDLNAGDVDSYDGDGSVWYDTHDFEFKPTTNVAQHFNAVIWNGDATTTRSITGVGFVPDLVWVKKRSGGTARNHSLHDVVRGAGNRLNSNTTSAGTDVTNEVKSFIDDGFTIGNGDEVNGIGSSQKYVAWCFKAGGAAVLNEEGTIDSQVSANNDLGFSVIKVVDHTGTKTIGHGLDSAPEMIIKKPITSSSLGWYVYHKELGNTKYLNLNTSSAEIDDVFWNDTNPTSSVFTSRFSNSPYDMLYFCFTSKRGVSKVGSYDGTNAAGNKVYTGFEPAFVMMKATSSGDWLMVDNKRAVSNGNLSELFADTVSSESGYGYDIDFNRDGFTLNTTTTNANGSNKSYIFYAVAKNTNETSLISDTNLDLHLDAGNTSSYSGSGTTWNDLTSNDYDGALTGVTWEQELGDSFDYTGGSSGVVVGDGGALTNGGTFTVEMWGKVEDNNTYRFLWGNMHTANGKRQIYCYIDQNDKLEVVLYYGNGSGDYRLNRTNSVASKVHNKWKHFVFTIVSGALSKIYINGLEEAVTFTSGGATAMHTSSSSNFNVGSNNQLTGSSFNGDIGQFRVYGSALTLAQVRQNFNFTKPRYPNEFHGDISGASWNSGGYFNFDGSNDAINLDTSIGSLFWANNWSSSIWVNFDSTSSANQSIFTSMGLAYNYLMTDNNTQLRYNNANGTDISTSSGTVSAGQWYHIVITRSSVDGTVIYVDKVSAGTNSSINNAAASNASGAKPQIGAYTSTGSSPNQYPLDGKVSKFKLYDKALTQAEIDALYAEGE